MIKETIKAWKNFILGLQGTLCLVLGILFIVSFITACTNDNPNSAFNIASTNSSDKQTISSSSVFQNQLSSSDNSLIPDFFADSCTNSGGQFLYGACICNYNLCDIGEVCNPSSKLCKNFIQEECPVSINERLADSAHYYQFNIRGGCQIIGAYDGSDPSEIISGNFMLLRYHGGISAEYQNLLASLGIYNYKFMDHHADITKISLFASAPITKAQLNANLPDFFNAFYPDTTGHKRLNLIKEDVNENHKINLTLYCEDNVYSCKNQALELGCEEVYIDRSVVLATCDIQATQKLQMNKITLGVNRPSLPDVLLD